MDETPKYAISVAAEFVGMHPQTLRLYEARRLVVPRSWLVAAAPGRCPWTPRARARAGGCSVRRRPASGCQMT